MYKRLKFLSIVFGEVTVKFPVFTFLVGIPILPKSKYNILKPVLPAKNWFKTIQNQLLISLLNCITH